MGQALAGRIKETVLGLQLDNRDLPMDRSQDEEEDLTRLLLAAAWYQVNHRSPIGFAYTPLSITAHEDPGAFTPERLLQLPHRDMVADVVAQLHKAADGPLEALRARSRPEDCTPGPTFFARHLTADADHAVDGLLLDFKSTRSTGTFRQAEACQLTGYVLLDAEDRYRIDTLGLFLTRSGSSPAGRLRSTWGCSGPAAATSPFSVSRSPSSSRAAHPTECRRKRRRKTACAGCCSAWRPLPIRATARSAPSAAPRPGADPESSAHPGAELAPRFCDDEDCCPAARGRCSPRRARSTWTSPTTWRL
ncbi:hypothetical protein [Streptomyces cadmiisoli]|uniref:hypothetical protein n=1 Tax=Streptomyces cadmiisoli TaxID=2184053 RepID=UPI003662F1AD